MDVQRERKPYIVVYDDGTVDVEVYQGRVETYESTTPIGFTMHPVPVYNPIRADYFDAPYRNFIMEGELRVGVRQRPKPPPSPPYNTVDLHELGASFDGVQRYERSPA
jgi:hypothetical protein